ncbi:MAG: glycosyltransferase family 4 protein, partial [Paracoccaceae bacterium]
MSLPIPTPDRDRPASQLARLYLGVDRAAPDPRGRPPGLIVTLPPAWGNKYQILLYQEAAAHRMAVMGARTPEDLDQISWPGPIVLHAHWFGPFFRTARDDSGARHLLRDVQDRLVAFRDRTGARLLWTAHNIYPHGNAFPQTFLDLRRWIFETFDALHVMQDAHVPVLETAFGRKAPPSFTVPHMSYAGIAPDTISRLSARAHLGIAERATVFGFFGSLQGYKNLPQFLRAVAPLAQAAPGRIAAVIGGVPSDPDTLRDIDATWGDAPWLRILPRDLPDHEIQYIHRASDVMVLPYETLNSGAALMAASYRTPVLMPDRTATPELRGHGLLTYDARDPDSLHTALAAIADRPPLPG